MGLLVACSPSEESAQSNEAYQQFQQAVAHVDNATLGYVNAQDYAGSEREYRAEQIAEAVSLLQPLTNKGTEQQQAAAAMMLSDLLASQARNAAADASTDWVADASVATKLLNTLSAAQQSHVMAVAHGNVTSEQALSDLRAHANELQQEQTSIRRTIEQLQSRITDLQDKQKQRTQRSKTFARRADDLQRQYEQAGDIDTQTELFTRSKQAQRRGSELAGQADAVASEIDKLQSELTVAQAQLDSKQQRIEQINQAIATINERGLRVDEVAAGARADADEFTTNLSGDVSGLAEQYTQKVVEPFETAADKIARAIEVLESAPRVRGASGQSVAFNLASRRAEQGHILRRYATARASYRDLLKLMASQADQYLPTQKAQAIVEQASQAVESAEAVKQRSIEALQAAVEPLAEVAESLRSSESQLAAYEQLAGVYMALANATGSMQQRQAAQAARQKVNELREELDD
jgi:chromosome segregation ATPase